VTASPIRLPDAGSIENALTSLDPASADAQLIPTLTDAFPGFDFCMARIDDEYWRSARSVIRPDGVRLGELQHWMTAELARENGDLEALWRRLKTSDLQITQWPWVIRKNQPNGRSISRSVASIRSISRWTETSGVIRSRSFGGCSGRGMKPTSRSHLWL